MKRHLISTLVLAIGVGAPSIGMAQLYNCYRGNVAGDVHECTEGRGILDCQVLYSGGYGGPWNSTLDETCETRAGLQSFPALTGACIFEDVVGEDFDSSVLEIGDVCFNFYESDGDDSASTCTERGGTFVADVDCSEAELPEDEEEPEPVPTLPLAGQGLLGLLLLSGALVARRLA